MRHASCRGFFSNLLDLVFPTEGGTIHSTSNVHKQCWGPLQLALGIADEVAVEDEAGAPKLDEAGRPVRQAEPRYTFHALRHAAASLFIEQGWTPKKVQVVMGHSSIQITFDVYGHLWHDLESDVKAMAQIEARLIG